MISLFVVVEGSTEAEFVKKILAPHLLAREVYASATIVGKVHAQRRGHHQRGGGAFEHWLEDIRRILGRDYRESLRVTTLFDLYGLPRRFPELDLHRTITDTNLRCDRLQAALANAVDHDRFIPYLQRHEFETLVLASLSSLAEFLDAKDDLQGIAQLEHALRDVMPEDVNDGRDTAPSKRLRAAIPGYEKPLHGPLAVEGTGLAVVRARCPRFDAWVRQLEQLGVGS